MLASTALDGTIAIWVMRGNRSLLWKTTPPGVAIFDMAFSPDKTTLVTAGGNGSLMRWEARSGRAIAASVQAHGDGAGSAVVAFHPNGKYFASGGRGGDIILWDAASGRKLHTLLRGDGESSGVDAMAFSPDGRLLAAVPGEEMLHFWNVGIWDTYTKHSVRGGIEKIASSATASAPMVFNRSISSSMPAWSLPTAKVSAGGATAHVKSILRNIDTNDLVHLIPSLPKRALLSQAALATVRVRWNGGWRFRLSHGLASPKVYRSPIRHRDWHYSANRGQREVTKVLN